MLNTWTPLRSCDSKYVNRIFCSACSLSWSMFFHCRVTRVINISTTSQILSKSLKPPKHIMVICYWNATQWQLINYNRFVFFQPIKAFSKINHFKAIAIRTEVYKSRTHIPLCNINISPLPWLQNRLFADLGQGVLDNAWQGYNAALFAYGQTGSGKSYSMTGYGANKGIVPITCEHLFKAIEANTDTKKQLRVGSTKL